MALFFDEPKKLRPSGVVTFLVILAIVLVIGYPEWELKYRNAQVKTVPFPAAYKEELRKVTSVNDGGFRSDGMDGRIFQHRFTQEGATAGRSPNELVITFDHPIELQGIHVSADCWKDTRLIEFVGGLNQKPAYQTNGDTTMLFHSTFATNDTAGAIEETFWYPLPFRIKPNEAIRIGAWIQNISPEARFVSPEFILYFTGLEAVSTPLPQPRRSWAPPKTQSLPPLPGEEIKSRKSPKKPTVD